MDNLSVHRHVLELAGLWDYSAIRGRYWAAVYDAVNLYLQSSGSVAIYKNRLIAAINANYPDAAFQAWLDTDSVLPLSKDANSFLASAIKSEISYVSGLFERLKMLRSEAGNNALSVASSEANRTAELWARSLDKLYASIKLLARPKTMLTFTGTDGKEQCRDCRRYKGKRHRARWWVANDAVPPSRSFECGGYNCQHYLVDDDGRMYTL